MTKKTRKAEVEEKQEQQEQLLHQVAQHSGHYYTRSWLCRPTPEGSGGTTKPTGRRAP